MVALQRVAPEKMRDPPWRDLFATLGDPAQTPRDRTLRNWLASQEPSAHSIGSWGTEVPPKFRKGSPNEVIPARPFSRTFLEPKSDLFATPDDLRVCRRNSLGTLAAPPCLRVPRNLLPRANSAIA